MNKWDIKELIEVVSKGINSVLMAQPNTDLTKLNELAKGLLKIYTEIYQELNKNLNEKGVNDPDYEN
ncbi:MAG: hypothetical protein QXD43_04850 [Candidatus Aenigmatarchaeota archaeon]